MSQPCYWCQAEVEICPHCFGMDGRIETCASCSATGFICPDGHAAAWVGNVPYPERGPEVDAWLRSVITNPWDHDITSALPFDGEEALSYIAFMADLNAYSRFPATDTDLRAIDQLKRIRDLAVQLGGHKPNVIRAGPR